MNTIVLGSNHNNTLGLIWSLGEAGHQVILLIFKHGNNYVAKSKYINKCYYLDPESDNVVSRLIDISRDLDIKPVVFVSSDKEAELLNNHIDELRPYCVFEGNLRDSSINKYRDKDEGYSLANKCGFTLPKCWVINNSKEIQSLPLAFPVFIKANNSIHGGKIAMKQCTSTQEAFSFCDSLPEDYYPLQVQEFIDKDYEIMLLGCSLDGGENVLCPVANKKIRHYPKPMGLGSYSESVYVPQHDELVILSEKVKHYIREIKYTGLFSAEFLYSNGNYYFLEINLRNDGTSWLSTCSGFNLPDMVCYGLAGKDYPNKSSFQKKFYMNIVADFHYVKDGSISFFKWLRLFNRKTCYSHLNFRDMRPFLYYIGSLLKH